MKDQEKSNVQINGAEDRITFTQMAAYGAGGIIPIALFNIAGILVGLMGNISLGLSAFWLGAILIVPRLWDALSDPIIGHLSDNTRTRWGRRRPYLLLGGILVALFFVVIWWIPKGDLVRVWFPTESGFQAFQLVYILISLLLFFTAVNIFEIPHGALGMEMTTDYHERTRLFSAKSFVGNLFAMSTPWLFALANLEIFKGPGGNEVDGMRYVSIMIAALIIPLSFWWSFKLREPGFTKVAKQVKTPFWKDMKHAVRNRNFIMLTLTIFTLAMGFNFVQLLGSYIPIFYVFGGDKVEGAYLLAINGTIWAITGVLAVFPLNWISPKLGKRNTLIISITLMCLAQLSKIVCYNPELPYLIIIPTVLLSAGMLFFFTLGSSMVGDICDEDELLTGNRSEGSFYSIFWWFIKMGSALASFVAGALIVLTSFDEVQVTKVDSLQGNIREMRAGVQKWDGYLDGKFSDSELREKIKNLGKDALDNSKKYLIVLERESSKNSENYKDAGSDVIAKRKLLLSEALASTKANISDLQELQTRVNDESTEARILAGQAIPMIQNTTLEKARLNSYELLAHFRAKENKSKRSSEHYVSLAARISGISDSLFITSIGPSIAVFDKQMEAIEKEIVPLTKQTPFTLLMMRVVEIGLPVILSLLSVLFILSYSLTEKRSHEIKELILQRSRETQK
jgi:glycoside/pentoside/hexuronide:cation symporter, GPH family